MGGAFRQGQKTAFCRIRGFYMYRESPAPQYKKKYFISTMNIVFFLQRYIYRIQEKQDARHPAILVNEVLSCTPKNLHTASER